MSDLAMLLDGVERHQPHIIDVPVKSGSAGEFISFDVNDFEMTTEGMESYAGILQLEDARVMYWVRFVEEFWRKDQWALAMELAEKGLLHFVDKPRSGVSRKESRIPLLCMLATYNIALARRAPSRILSNPRQDRLSRTALPNHPESKDVGSALPQRKDYYYKAAEMHLKEAADLSSEKNPLVRDGRASLALAQGDFKTASSLFEETLIFEPTNLYALMGRGRSLYGLGQFQPALKAYRTVLSYAPKFLPDPRIGIGLCFYSMKQRSTAVKAWERSVAVHPGYNSNTATILLGIASMNQSRDSNLPGGDVARVEALQRGFQIIRPVLTLNPACAAAAGACAVFALTTGKAIPAMKFAERMIQHSEIKRMTSDGYLYLGRALQSASGDNRAGEMFSAAMSAYDQSLQHFPGQFPATLAVSQTLTAGMTSLRDASNMLRAVLLTQPTSIETLVTLASIHSRFVYDSAGAAESMAERKQAKDLYEQALRLISTANRDAGTSKVTPLSARLAAIMHDPFLHIDLAQLYLDESDLEKSLKAFREAARIFSEELELPVPPRLLNNIAVIALNKGKHDEALGIFEEQAAAMTELAKTNGSIEVDATLTAVTFNLAVAYEATGETDRASVLYGHVLNQHPEFVDAKARLALMAIKSKDYDTANYLIRAAMTSQQMNLELRALYTYFLLQTNQIQECNLFTLPTLKMNRHDVYQLCAMGWTHFLLARDNKDASKSAARDRTNKFFKAVELYEKALQLDPACTFAAQGIAISVAEGLVGNVAEDMGGGTTGVSNEAVQRLKNSRDALSILMKVKESLNDGSVYVNIGHCHFAREEWEKAIENFETASQRFYHGKNIPVLLYLARSWYHKGNKDTSFADLQASIATIKMARALQPADLANIYNLAMVQQKAVEILFDTHPSRRSRADIDIAVEDCNASLELFEQLKAETHSKVPYHKDIPQQRLRYGTGLLKRAADVIAAQDEYDQEEAEKLEIARMTREAERKRLAEIAAVAQAEETRRAEMLAQQRQIMRDETAKWAEQNQRQESDDEAAERKKKEKKGVGKKRTKAKKGEGDEESSAEESDAAKPKKKRSKASKKKDVEEGEGSDEDEPVQSKKRNLPTRAKKGKEYKSNQFVADSEEEEEDEEEQEKDDAGGAGEASSTAGGDNDSAAPMELEQEREKEEEDEGADEEKIDLDEYV